MTKYVYVCVIYVQILKEEEDRILVHYTNYSDKFDRWIQKDALITNLPYHPLPFTVDYISEQLKLEIKEKLFCRIRQSSEVIIKIDCTEALFSELFNCNPETSLHPSNSELDTILGHNWNRRIINQQGETCIVIDLSVYIKLKKRQPVVEYIIGEDNVLQEQRRQRVPYLYFSFVRKAYPSIPMDH